MNHKDYSSEFAVGQSADEVYARIVDVRSWWRGDIAGRAERVGDVFRYRNGDLHDTRQRVSALVPGRKVAWHVEGGTIAFVDDRAEWDGTEIVFEITPQGDGSLVRITHYGLVPEKECFDACAGGWNYYFGQSLKAAITGAVVEPAPWEA